MTGGHSTGDLWSQTVFSHSPDCQKNKTKKIKKIRKHTMCKIWQMLNGLHGCNQHTSPSEEVNHYQFFCTSILLMCIGTLLPAFIRGKAHIGQHRLETVSLSCMDAAFVIDNFMHLILSRRHNQPPESSVIGLFAQTKLTTATRCSVIGAWNKLRD